MPPTSPDDLLYQRARIWLERDPDPATRAELENLLATWPAARDEVADRFSGRLRFGTAGLRGPLRAGPNGMNRAVVRYATAGLVAWLTERRASGPVVVGFDARHGSRAFAEDCARVVTGAGLTALLLPRPLPTPVLAAAVRRLGACAGVMVTASHNPPRDNGYKVYLGAELGGPLGAGAQIAPPIDARIEAAIATATEAGSVRLGPEGTVLGEEVVDSYVAAVAGLVNAGALTTAYSAMHGVGGRTFLQAMATAGFPPPVVVPEQHEPDPDFPTLPFPNPEEPGAMDRVLALAAEVGADLAIAHDPDADRCAVAVPPSGPTGDPRGWRVLRGDELGCLLADHLIRRGVPGRYATTIVSSTLLSHMCESRGVDYGETLTGFKWIMRAGEDVAFGYEEALGYCVAPHLVRDKDGISAALLVCELASELARQGRTLVDRLDELAGLFGVHATDQVSARVSDLTQITRTMADLRAAPPASLAGRAVTAVEDLLPRADVVIVRAGGTRVVVRPSGTEPKLKAYLEVVAPVTGGDLASARERAAADLDLLRTDVTRALGLKG